MFSSKMNRLDKTCCWLMGTTSVALLISSFAFAKPVPLPDLPPKQEQKEEKKYYEVEVTAKFEFDGSSDSHLFPAEPLVFGMFQCSRSIGLSEVDQDSGRVQVECLMVDIPDVSVSTNATCSRTKPGNRDVGYLRLVQGDQVVHIMTTCFTRSTPIEADTKPPTKTRA